MAKVEPRNYQMKDGKSFTIRSLIIEDAQPLIDFVYNFEVEYEFRLTEKDKMKLTLEKDIGFINKLSNEANSLGLVAIFEKQIIGFLDFNN